MSRNVEWRPSAAMVSPRLDCLPRLSAKRPTRRRSLRQKISRFGLHQQMEIGKLLRPLAEEIQKVPLRHQGDEFAGGRQIAEIADGEMPAADLQIGGTDLAVRKFEKFLQQPQLVHHFQGRGMHRVAAEIAQEILVLLQHGDVDAGAGQKKAQHHPGRPPPAMTHVVEICCMTLPADDLVPPRFSYQAAPYQDGESPLYFCGNNFEKEVIQCLIVIPCRVPRPGFCFLRGPRVTRRSQGGNAKGRVPSGARPFFLIPRNPVRSRHTRRHGNGAHGAPRTDVT